MSTNEGGEQQEPCNDFEVHMTGVVNSSKITKSTALTSIEGISPPSSLIPALMLLLHLSDPRGRTVSG